MTTYSQIDANGYIVYSQYTEDPNFFVPEGCRLLPDVTPQPPEWIPGFTRPLRIEPVPADATAVQYKIIKEERPAREHEVIL